MTLIALTMAMMSEPKQMDPNEVVNALQYTMQ